MIALLSLATLFVATVFALATATAFQWLLLQVACRLMQPATAYRRPARPELVRGTKQLTHAFIAHR